MRNKRVRVMLELDSHFVALLNVSIQMNSATLGHVTGKATRQLSADEVLTVLICAEARGGYEAEVDALIPLEWRPHISVVHSERCVIEEVA